jgi:hypothetical protein
MNNILKFPNVNRIMKATCDHKNGEEFDYSVRSNGLCHCNKCGQCMNSRMENYPGFTYSKDHRARLVLASVVMNERFSV